LDFLEDQGKAKEIRARRDERRKAKWSIAFQQVVEKSVKQEISVAQGRIPMKLSNSNSNLNNSELYSMNDLLSRDKSFNQIRKQIMISEDSSPHYKEFTNFSIPDQS
jgi:PBP1b-binding outer membrane lipoprotein LpoB